MAGRFTTGNGSDYPRVGDTVEHVGGGTSSRSDSNGLGQATELSAENAVSNAAVVSAGTVTKCRYTGILLAVVTGDVVLHLLLYGGAFSIHLFLFVGKFFKKVMIQRSTYINFG